MAILRALFGISLVPLILARAVSRGSEGDAPYSLSTRQLAGVLDCPHGDPTDAEKTILLVHGTATTAKESWGAGYLPALTLDGYQVCTITLRMSF